MSKRSRRSSSSDSSTTAAAADSSTSSARASMSNAIRVPSSSSLNNLSLLAGGAYGGAASAFTETAYHGQLVCCGCGHVIKIMSIKTGQVLHTLRGHTETVTGLAVSPRHALQLFSSSRDGTVIVWNISNGTKVDTHHLVNGAPILDISLPASPSSTSDSDIIYVVAEVRAGGGGKLDKSTRKAYSYNIKTKKVERMVMKGLKGGGSMEVAFRQISRGNMEGVTTHTKKKSKGGGVVLEPGVTVVAGITKKTLKIWNSTTSKARKFIHTNKLTSIALHPTAPHAATGDECGRIQLWYNVARPSSSGNTTTTTTLHWHSHRLHALCFTPDGHYLLSGGEESVLVIWQLRTLKKQFLPRLGSTIVAISVAPDGMHYIVGTDDNTVHVIDSSTLQTSWKLTGIGCAVSPTTTQYSNFKPSQYLYTGMAIDPRTRCFMLNSTLGSGRLQLYDYHRDRHVQFVDVAPRNVVSRVDKKRMHPTVVERIVFSPDGMDMVTVDRRTDDHGFDDVTSLKFWEYNTTSGEYVLNTKVRAPHSQLISALTFAYSPSRGKIVATASHDHKFKIWRPTTMKVGPSSVSRASKGDSSSSTAQSRVVWDCHSVGFYRDMPITDATLSGDGSILAVAYSNIVTLWSPLDNMLQHTLPHPHGKDDKGVTSVSFVGGSPLLVTTTDDDIYVWNLLTCDVIWELRGVKPLMVCCTSGTSWKDTSRIALLTNHTSSKRVLLFNAMISTPIYSWSIPDGIKPMSVWFEAKSGGGHRSSESDSLLLVSENVQLYQLHQNSVSSSSTSTNATLLSGTQNLSNFERMFGQRKGGVTGSGGSGGTFLHQHHNDHDMVLVDGPSHVVASVSSLFDSFMRQSAGEDAVIVKSTRNQEELLEKYATPSATATAAVNTFSNSVAAQEDIVVAQEEGMVQFDTASEEMMLEWFSKDGELLEPSSKKVLKKAALKSSSKKKRVAADSKKTTTRKSKRLRK